MLSKANNSIMSTIAFRLFERFRIIHSSVVSGFIGIAFIVQAATPEGALHCSEKTPGSIALQHGKYFGSLYDDCCYPRSILKPQTDLLESQFTIITNAHFFMNLCHPLKDKYDFKGADYVDSFAVANKLRIRAHNLIWYPYVPVWLSDTNISKVERSALVELHIKTVVGRYKGRVYAWDVVNEALENDGSLRNSFYYQNLGPDYIEKAFCWAHEADPSALLFYNDYNTEEVNRKSDSMYAMVKQLKKKGVPISGIGFQMHLDLENKINFNSIWENIRRFAALGVEIHFTEVDVRIEEPITESKLLVQAAVYGEIARIFMEEKQCKAFVLWGINDRISWIPRYFKGYGGACIFDSLYRPKPAYDTLMQVFESFSK